MDVGCSLIDREVICPEVTTHESKFVMVDWCEIASELVPGRCERTEDVLHLATRHYGSSGSISCGARSK